MDVIGLENGLSAVAAGGDHTCALTLGGGVKCWGRNDEYGQVGDGSTINRNEPVDVVGLQSGVATVALGSNHTCVLTSRGEVKCWGDNRTGQLGVSPIRDRSIPVDVVGLTGGITSITAVEINWDQALLKEVDIRNSFASTWISWDYAIKLLESGKVQTSPLVSEVLPITRWEYAFDRFGSRQGIKFVLIPQA